MKVYEVKAVQSKKSDDGHSFAARHGRDLPQQSKKKSKSAAKRRLNRRLVGTGRAVSITQRILTSAVLNVQNHQFSDETLDLWAKKIEEYQNEFDTTGKLSADFFDFK